MTNKKKTFYEILAVSPGAALQEIQETYQNLVLSLQSQRSLFKLEEYELKLKIINLAFNTLSNQASRHAYDAELAARMPPAIAPAYANALALQPDPASVALRAEAMSLRADAISLRADALSIKSNAGVFGDRGAYPLQNDGVFSALGPFFRKFLMLLGVLVAAWMVGQVIYLLMSNRRTSVDAATTAKASEKLAIQEYYQAHGVRPASKAELDLLETENRRKDNETRAGEREKTRAEEESRRFEQETRRRAAEVSAELRYSENQAREQARREDEQKRYQAEEQKRAEQRRIEQERYRWQETLRR